MTSFLSRGPRVLSRRDVLGKSYQLDSSYRDRNNIDYGAYCPLGGFCPKTFCEFSRQHQGSSNAVSTAELVQTDAEKIKFFEKKLNLSKPETRRGRGLTTSSSGRGPRVV